MIDIRTLPGEIGPFEAVEAAYPDELTRTLESIQRGLPVLIECDKGLVPYFFRGIRDRLRREKIQCLYLDGRVEPAPGQMPMGLLQTLLTQIREAVRTATEAQVVVLPHLDLLTTSQGGLTSEAKEAVTLLYENPNLLVVGFKDPTISLPDVIKHLFAQTVSVIGVNRDRLRYLVTQREARKLSSSQDFNPYQLYSHVSGVHAVQLRKILSSLRGEDFPQDTKSVYDQIRKMTCPSDISMPNVDLVSDIGGYPLVKEQIQSEILSLLNAKNNLDDPEMIKEIESIIPRGIIFHGPPGTGKTYFAKAMATALNATLTVVSGPEIKSKWVGESEERIRQIFAAARASAPSIIVFDELDSIAPARGTYTGSGVEHSMVNQLLTELDGFRKNELVFVIATTNFVESLDPALLRPGRLECHIEIPYPDEEDRREILAIHGKKMRMTFSKEGLDYAVKVTGGATTRGTSYSGDDLQALCRALARYRLRNAISAPVDKEQIRATMDAYAPKLSLTEDEERVVAYHESGHALCSMYTEGAPAIDKISISSEISGALGFVKHISKDRIQTKKTLFARLVCLMGGQAAEGIIYGTTSVGCAQDLKQATLIAREMIANLGMGGSYLVLDKNSSQSSLGTLDHETDCMLTEAAVAAVELINKHKAELEKMVSLLCLHKELTNDMLAEHGFPVKR